MKKQKIKIVYLTPKQWSKRPFTSQSFAGHTLQYKLKKPKTPIKTKI